MTGRGGATIHRGRAGASPSFLDAKMRSVTRADVIDSIWKSGLIFAAARADVRAGRREARDSKPVLDLARASTEPDGRARRCS